MSKQKKIATKPQTILYIDDEPAWLEVVRLALKEAPFKIVTAEGSEAALKALHKKTPDLILSDVRMPIINGFDLYLQIKHNPKYQNVPYVFMSSIDDFDAKRTAKELGADGYIEKSIDSDQIKSTILDLLSRLKSK